jgi:hypothetical protein
VGVLEELPLPLVEQGRIDLELIAHGGNGDTFEKMAFDDSHLLLGSEVAAGLLVGHGDTSVWVMLTRTVAFSRFD